MLEASSFSRRFPSTSSPDHLANCFPSWSYFLPPLWLAYRFARVMPIWMNFRDISAPTKSPRTQNDSKISQRTSAEFVATGTVRNAQYGSMRPGSSCQGIWPIAAIKRYTFVRFETQNAHLTTGDGVCEIEVVVSKGRNFQRRIRHHKLSIAFARHFCKHQNNASF